MTALLADIGGTNARFALYRDGRIGPAINLAVAAFARAEDAIVAALGDGTASQAVLAVAGPVADGQARLTNAPWLLDAEAIAARFGLARVQLVNDFGALAHALPHLGDADLVRIGGGAAVADAPMLVLGPGTGLGAGGLVPTPSGWTAVATEAGHAGLAPTDAAQDALVVALRARCGRAGAEEALSGRGLAMLHTIIAEGRIPARDAAQVVAAAPTCPVARQAVDTFLALLAGFAGDMALAWGARGGVFLGGGILPRLLPMLDPTAFRARFEDRPPMRQYLQSVPLAVIIHPAPAFPGLAALADAPR